MNGKLINKIYWQLQDEISREIYKNRLMYTITGDKKYVFENVKLMNGRREFLDQLDRVSQDGEMVIFGAGFWGKDMYSAFSGYPWKYFIDNDPHSDSYDGIPILRVEDFIRDYHGEYIFISSRIYHTPMYQQLIDQNIPEEKIIDVGGLLDDLSKKQYFDLKYLPRFRNGEVFVDAGSLDGMTSVYFKEWCKEIPAMVYAFEPDEKNQKKCYENLMQRGISFQIIPKGVWSTETTLTFCSNSNGTSKVAESGNVKIEVTTLDSALQGIGPTFIKMDIEGSELQALKGAEKTIKIFKPKLAISIYHKPEDIWELPEIILKYNPDYKLYLRHYSFTASETVLYAI